MALLTHFLACLFGTGSWMAINGVWVELPLLVNQLPEGWYLPSYLIIIIQLANVGPLFVTVMHKWKPRLLSEVSVICVLVSMGTGACFLLAFLWDRTTVVAGQRHSTAFFVLTFALSLVDCTSSVTFLPFMMRLHPRYVPTFFIGEGLSGLIPALFALAQGSGVSRCVNVTIPKNATAADAILGNASAADVDFHTETQYFPAHFSSLVFFLVLSGMMFCCLGAFFFLNRLPKVWELSQQKLCVSNITLTSVQNSSADGQRPTEFGVFADYPADGQTASSAKTGDSVGPENVTCSRAKFTFVYFLVAWVNALTNGILPSVQSYSCLPYSNMAYHLAATLGSMANPLACTLATFLPSRSLPVLGTLALTGTMFGAYNMAMAAMSPCPLLQRSEWGDAIIVISWVLFTGTLSYIKVMTGVILRGHSHSALVWYGAVEQLGSLLGAVVMFPLVSVYSLFKSADFCNFQCPA
ncbi:solute carrier family 52, riboflavin transporter, member 3 [Heteronotia binoei]|uniref:solute carrier family 52, riboflavin transporter, member 3 n=1 Tax=Heteronotia binoei TaxID=13085 RepID=UPI00292FD775|nr:solute carrier family 52, riboflavin transporter, member 3 [Heteronotia binoei]